MTKESVYVGVDVAKDTLDVAVRGSHETRQFTNDHEGIAKAVQYIAGLQPAGIVLEATGNLEIHLADGQKKRRYTTTRSGSETERWFGSLSDRCHQIRLD